MLRVARGRNKLGAPCLGWNVAGGFRVTGRGRRGETGRGGQPPRGVALHSNVFLERERFFGGVSLFTAAQVGVFPSPTAKHTRAGERVVLRCGAAAGQFEPGAH